MPISLPPVPAEVPVLVETSFAHQYGPEHHGIDVDTQWWCEVTRRPRSDDAIASVTPPGVEPYRPMLNVTLAAEDLDETEAVGHYAIRIARCVVRLLADRDDQGAMAELRSLLSPSGPVGKGSKEAWDSLYRWLDSAAVVDRCDGVSPIEVDGWGRPVELWTLTRVAEYLGYQGASAAGSARKQLHRWGITAEGRAPGRGGESLFAADQVQAAHASRPGRGRRTDLIESGE